MESTDTRETRGSWADVTAAACILPLDVRELGFCWSGLRSKETTGSSWYTVTEGRKASQSEQRKNYYAVDYGEEWWARSRTRLTVRDGEVQYGMGDADGDGKTKHGTENGSNMEIEIEIS